jgi:hypothetical protein
VIDVVQRAEERLIPGAQSLWRIRACAKFSSRTLFAFTITMTDERERNVEYLNRVPILTVFVGASAISKRIGGDRVAVGGSEADVVPDRDRT